MVSGIFFLGIYHENTLSRICNGNAQESLSLSLCTVDVLDFIYKEACRSLSQTVLDFRGIEVLEILVLL